MSSLASFVLVSLGALDAAKSASISIGAEEAAQVNVAFNKFVIEHGRDYKHGTSEYDMRKALFQQRLAAVNAQNALPGQIWEAGTSYFSDLTESERSAVLGYRRGKWSEQRGFSMLEMNSTQATLPKEKDWTTLKVAKKVPNQGSCGSCWAFSTVSVIDAHFEIWAAKTHGGKHRFFSQQQVVDCTPNPNACGGSGGCGGATVELGMDWINKHGLASLADVPYKGSDGKCTVGGKSLVSASEEVDGEDSESDAFAQLQPKASPAGWGQTGASIGMMGYSTLPSNVDQPLAEAVANYGPVGVAVAAGAWFEYSKGVFDGCKKDGVLDHAVTLYGYGEDKGTKYWNIRNSYGPNWGEHGFIRMKRFGNGKEQHCGVDKAPEEGVACKNGPKEVKICGMCGILYDSVVPYFKGSPGPHPKGSATPPQSGMAPVSLMRAEVSPH